MSKNNDSKTNLHKGHRERLTNQFLEYGIESLSENQVLELMLFYAIPRKDTNDLAHILINEFGSIEGVISAPIDKLMQIDGIGKNTASLLHLFFSVPRFTALSKIKGVTRFKTVDDVQEYLKLKFYNLTHERVYMLLVDNSLKLIDCVTLSDGSISGAQIDHRVLVETALNKRAAGVILAHNHPGGLSVPSSDDIDTTKTIDRILNSVGITLIEHIVVGEKSCDTVMNLIYGYRRSSAHVKSPGFNENFFEKFYSQKSQDAPENE